MKTSCPPTVELPSVEECIEATSEITDELLGDCMRRQCRDVIITCSEWSRRQCLLDNQSSGKAVLAFTMMLYRGTLHSFYPVREIHWCEEPASQACVVKAVIHEVAHSCGWDHGEGQNVPGNDSPEEDIVECACIDEKGRRVSCN
jgi:hypothetical protein